MRALTAKGFPENLQKASQNRLCTDWNTCTNKESATEVNNYSSSFQILPDEFRLRMLDLHTCNLAFAIPFIHSLREEEFFQRLGNPETGLLRRNDRKPLDSGVPEYLVRPTSYPADLSLSFHAVKIIDFGESFFDHKMPDTLHTPLPVRAPEIIFKDKLDHNVDLWSMGCMVSPNCKKHL